MSISPNLRGREMQENFLHEVENRGEWRYEEKRLEAFTVKGRVCTTKQLVHSALWGVNCSLRK